MKEVKAYEPFEPGSHQNQLLEYDDCFNRRNQSEDEAAAETQGNENLISIVKALNTENTPKHQTSNAYGDKVNSTKGDMVI